MSTNLNTQRLQLPLLAAGQAQKHVTHNEALLALDATVQLAVEDASRTLPPPAPVEGERRLVAAGAAGAWAGRQGEIAVFETGAWRFLTPRRGWRVWVADIAAMLVFDGATWGPLKAAAADRLGINATPDAGNRLSVSSPASLFSHEGAGHQIKINKAAASATGSLLFQTGFSGRAEMGLAGSDDFSVKVSAAGTAWKEALAVNPSTGEVRFPSGFVDAGTGLRPLTFLPAPPRDIWRSDVDAPATPRNYSVAAISGQNVTIATNEVEQFYNGFMQNMTMVRVWNISKAPAQAAWANWNNAANAFRVSDAAHVAGWLPGETLRVGDPNPTGANLLQMVALDLSGFLFASYGVVFRQRGVKMSMSIPGVGGRAGMDCSGSGAAGTAFGSFSGGDGSRQATFVDIFTSELSPVSNSNLLFVREFLSAPATAMGAVRFLRVVGIWI